VLIPAAIVIIASLMMAFSASGTRGITVNGDGAAQVDSQVKE
jgi:hypothetical protein